MMVFFVGRETSLGTLCQGIPTPVLYKHAVGMDVKQKITRSSHQSRLPVACAPLLILVAVALMCKELLF